jgi:hypothetical protein
MQRLRWTASILAIVLAVAVIGFLLRRGEVSAAKEEAFKSSPVSAPQAAKEEAPKSSPVSAPQAAKEEAPKSSPVSAPGAASTAATKAGPGIDDPRPAEGPSTAATKPDPASLQTIGTLIAAHYFQTYLNIGFIADGKGKGNYTSEEARKVLRSVLSIVDSVDRQLEALGKRGLDKEDRDSLDQMRAISALLRQQSSELQSFWDSGQDQHATRYETLRKTSYTAISKLMGIAP